MRTVRSGRYFGALLLFTAPILCGQQSTAESKSVIINFVAPITGDTVNNLIRVVTDQATRGNSKITILISSGGGDTTAGLAAYNILRHLNNAEITTFNIGNVDSAAMLLFCAGSKRYSLPGPGTRFLIHGNGMNPQLGVPVDVNFWDSQVQQLKSLNQMVVQVISEASHDKRAEIEAAVRSQTILSPEQAKEWGIVQDIRTDFMEPGAKFLAISSPAPLEPKPVPEFLSETKQ